MRGSVVPIRPEVLAAIIPGAAARAPFAPAARGFSVVYRVGDAPDCPGCHHSHWLVGRVLAECAFCGTALPITE
jgi:hypothetical protein